MGDGKIGILILNPSLYSAQDGAFTKGEVVSKPDVKNFGQSSFVDFDGDGYQDHLLPACLDNDCQQSTIYLAKRSSKE
ncbi:hypothetical protein CHARACLAT_011861, partial [Characodon lateralis]|nr:hypothetical protein [Characodon lateralis]